MRIVQENNDIFMRIANYILISLCYNSRQNSRKEVNGMSKQKKRRRPKPATPPNRMESFLADILTGIISGLITAAILKLLGW